MKLSEYKLDQMKSYWELSNKSKTWAQLRAHLIEYYRPVGPKIAYKITDDNIRETARQFLYNVDPFESLKQQTMTAYVGKDTSNRGDYA